MSHGIECAYRHSILVSRARNGFDIACGKTDASRGSMVGHVKSPMQTLNANNIVNIDMAPSVAEADAILAGFGYSEPVAIAA